jgi:predicted membrane protein
MIIDSFKRREKMGLALALIVMGVLIFLDRLGTGYGLREGWPWLVVALGIGGLFRNSKSVPAWITTILGILILGAKYYSIQFSIPSVIKTYFLPVLLIIIGLLWLLKYKKD